MSQSVRPAPDAEPARTGVPTPAPPTPAPPTPAPPTPAGAGLLDRRFGRDEIAVVRHEVSGRLAGAGLAGERLQGYVLAVNEVITNVVLHAGGQGRVVLWLTRHDQNCDERARHDQNCDERAGGSAWCTVTDSGPGIPARYLRPPEVPGTFEVGGRGIWLAYQLCDEVTVATGPIGTTIGLRIALPRRSTSS